MNDNSILAKEQETLELYFYALGHFAYDKAKEIAERERETSTKSQVHSSLFINMLTDLTQLAVAEKSYAGLMFLIPKGFLRKEHQVLAKEVLDTDVHARPAELSNCYLKSSAKSVYESLKHDFRRLEEKSYGTQSPSTSPTLTPTPPSNTPSPPTPTPSVSSTLCSGSPMPINNSASSTPSIVSSLESAGILTSLYKTTGEVLEKLSGHICGQLHHFTCARLSMMEVYEKLYSVSVLRNRSFEFFDELVEQVQKIIECYQNQFHHPLLNPVKSAFSYECEILHKLLDAQVAIQSWNFLQSVLHLYEAHTKLNAWGAPVPPREPKRFSTAVRAVPQPAYFQWLAKFKSHLVSKFGFYFRETLTKQTTSSNEIKNLYSKASVDYFQRIVAFQKKTESVCVALVFDSHGLEDNWGHGYRSPHKPYEPPKGLDSYPAAFCYPTERPDTHWPSIIMIINDKGRELHNGDIITFHDPVRQTAYFLCRTDPRMTLVAIYENRKSDRDTYITNFLQDFCSQLRGTKIVAMMKPGSK